MTRKELTPEKTQEKIERWRKYRREYYRLHRDSILAYDRALYKKNHKPKGKRRYFEVVKRGPILFKME